MVSETGLKVRMAIVGALLFGFYLLIAQLFLAMGIDVVWVVVGLAGFVGVQYYLGRRMALKSVGARTMTATEYPEIHSQVDALCAEMDLEKPRLLIAQMGTPNAFAVGRRGNGVVVLSESLLEILDPDEVEAVIAHELAHIDNRDVVLMVLGQSIAAIVGFLVFLGVHVVGRRSIIVTIIALVFGTIAKFIVTLLVLAMSRYREYVADETAAAATGRPEALASALAKISAVGSALPEHQQESVSALCISGGASSLLSTHPSPEKRIHRLDPGMDPVQVVEEFVAEYEPRAACPACKQEVHPEWTYCEACGEPLETAGHGPTCPGCGMAVDPTWSYCDGCGKPLETATADRRGR